LRFAVGNDLDALYCAWETAYESSLCCRRWESRSASWLLESVADVSVLEVSVDAALASAAANPAEAPGSSAARFCCQPVNVSF
jgi:hypothetical protein